MSQITINSESPQYPQIVAKPIISYSPAWNGPWTVDNSLEFISCAVRVSNAQSTCEIRRRYGNVKQPYDATFKNYPPINLDGYYVMLQLGGSQGYTQVFAGVVDSINTKLTGDDANRSGMQSWVARGGLRFLERCHISGSIFQDTDSTLRQTGWLAAMNARDKRGMLVGNRCVSPPDDFGYVHQGGSGAQVWSHYDYLTYLLNRFVTAIGGPPWTIAGQIDILKSLQTTIEFSQSASVSSMIAELIPVKYGVDFQVVPSFTSDAGVAAISGFQINVFAVTNQAGASGGVSIPSNPNVIQIDRGDQLNMIDVQLVVSRERLVDKIQVLGKRIVVCGSLQGKNSELGSTSLVPKWASGIETSYISADGAVGTAGLTAENFDNTRRRCQKFREVYQHFGAPAGWDLDGQAWDVYCVDGVLTSGKPAGYPNSKAQSNYQTTVRQTLPWTPLKEGWDYTTSPPTDNTQDTSEADPDYRPPSAWIQTPQAALTGGYNVPYAPVEDLGIHVSVPFNDWGVFLKPRINHLLALGQWTPTQLQSTEIPPDYDYTTLVATIAIESDQRLSLSYSLPSALAAGDGSVMTIFEESAEGWVLLPFTVLDVDSNGNFLYSPEQLTILRDDSDRLQLAMAGAAVRYTLERARAVCTFKGLLAWGNFVSNILSVIQQGDLVQLVGGPITSIEWHGESTETILKTGYA